MLVNSLARVAAARAVTRSGSSRPVLLELVRDAPLFPRASPRLDDISFFGCPGACTRLPQLAGGDAAAAGGAAGGRLAATALPVERTGDLLWAFFGAVRTVDGRHRRHQTQWNTMDARHSSPRAPPLSNVLLNRCRSLEFTTTTPNFDEHVIYMPQDEPSRSKED